ncbi:hypothetical protein CIPAW_15G161200 [Carya illinoinensis]|uniref:Uncharacterized protein n=1 Tax=Carya illinoinensis TaxID=32201 RepID=A0A8T1NFZ9_CARIL|nr:hypothetical protein CIPAW_15G161200 [Carya illinoinensis]
MRIAWIDRDQSATSSEHREQEDCRKLLLAALNGDWENARAIIEKDPARMLSANLTKGEDKVIHIAVTAKRIPFIKQLVDLMSEKGLILNIQNYHGDTCLSIAAVSGKVEIAELIMAKDNANQLLSIHGIYELIPLGMAIRWGHGEMAHYLWDKMELEPHSCLSSTTPDLMKLFIMSISNHLYDVALRLLNKDMEMACKRDGDQKTALHVLAQKAPDTDPPIKSGNWPLFSSSKKRIKFGFVVSFIPKFKGFCKQASTRTSSELERVELLENILNELQKKSIEEISEILKSTSSEVVKTTTTEVIKSTTSEVVKTTTSEVVKITTSGVLFDAAMSGNVEFLDKVLRKFPSLIWENDEKDRSIFHVAIKYRQEKVFNLIYNIGAVKDYLVGNKDSDGNNMLHLAGMLPDDQERLGVQRANLQMQRELLWFKVFLSTKICLPF